MTKCRCSCHKGINTPCPACSRGLVEGCDGYGGQPRPAWAITLGRVPDPLPLGPKVKPIRCRRIGYKLIIDGWLVEALLGKIVSSSQQNAQPQIEASFYQGVKSRFRSLSLARKK